ncbi:hypothetical protein [Shimia sagamensis]|uniref:Sulfotransferase family protein n=1 Tax=Shimia sagamensis TaxID=1566352 RepID=A0ABY1NBG7_9RHOB|nr:hypothetical protein [Shimia sagamensis]SMP05550.1 hypothetical protein SAMN06265373_101577 [Shimia sagamensis]
MLKEIEIGNTLNFAAQPISLADLKFLFLFCPNNSGSTVLSQYLAEQLGAYLPPFGNFEGQMVPSVRDMMRDQPWRKETIFDWSFIRAEWEKKANGRLFIEGSPPNIVRSKEIAKTFGEDSTAILSISNPYQQIASSVRRYHTPGVDVAKLAAPWLRKANLIREIRERHPHFPLFKYDDFTRDPRIVNQFFDIPVHTSKVRGKKGSDGENIRNMRAVTTLFLTEQEIDAISTELSAKHHLVEYFGYSVLTGKNLLSALSQDKAAVIKARERRVAWDARQHPSADKK